MDNTKKTQTIAPDIKPHHGGFGNPDSKLPHEIAKAKAMRPAEDKAVKGPGETK